MKNPAISILIPVYKVEQYLKRCIDSVLSQDFQDWEMILVDDGSPDSCGEICDAYVSEYPNKIKVFHKKNGGLLSARRAGVKLASGKYFVFVDSDDTLCPGALSVLYNNIEKGYDMVRGGAMRITNDGVEYPLESYAFEEGELNGENPWALYMYKGNVAPYIWGAIYKASLFSDKIYELPMQQGINMGEDWVINMILAKNIRRTLYIKDLVYNYYVNANSYMSTSVMSSDYFNKVEFVLKNSNVYDNKEVREYAPVKYCVNILNNFFVPELAFHKHHYDYVINCLKDEMRSKDIKSNVLHKRLRFIRCYPIYRMYAEVYKLLIRFFKLKNKHRKVVF